LRVVWTWRPLHAVRARLTLQAVRARLTLRVVRARLPWRSIRARLSLRAELARLSLLSRRAEVTGLALRVVWTWRPLHAVRTWLALGTVRARLPWLTVTAWPGETAGGVPRCRRVSGDRAVSWHGPGGSAWPRKSSRPESTGCWSTRTRSSGCRPARSGETALARERARAGKRATGRGTPLTWECAIGGEVSRAGEWPLGRVWVLGRARGVTVRRTVARSAADRGVSGPTGGVGFAALGRDDQAARRVDGGRGQDPFPIGVDMGNRPGGAIRDVAAGKRTLTLVRGGRARRRTDVAAGPRGTRCQRSRPGRPSRKPSGRDQPGARPVRWSLSGRGEATGRPVLTGRVVLGRAELPARHRPAGQDARTELTRRGELSRSGEPTGSGERVGSGERPRRGELSRGHRSAVRHPWAGHELPGR
jgi:hypothetical protein